jgi:hypothetical protein
MIWYYIKYLTVIGLPPGGSSSVHIYKQTTKRTTQNKQYIEQHQNYTEQHKNWEECGPCPVFAGFTLTFALQLKKKHGKTSVRVVINKHTIRIHSNNENTKVMTTEIFTSNYRFVQQTSNPLNIPEVTFDYIWWHNSNHSWFPFIWPYVNFPYLLFITITYVGYPLS